MIKIEDKTELGKNAAIFFGGYQDSDNDETRWCTSGPGLTFFNGYIKDGPLYVVLPNDDNGQVGKRTGLPKERYQFHFPSSQFMDRLDRHVNLTELLNGPMIELKESFKPEFAKGLVTKGGDKVEINYPNDSAENARLGSSQTAHASTPNGFGTMGKHATFHATRQCSAIANRSDLSGNNTHEKTTHPRRLGSPILRASPR